MSGIASAARCGYWGWKIFQAARLCVGDVSALVELLSEGCAELVAEEIVCVAMEASQLAENMNDVGKFTQKLSTELATHEGGAAAAERMQESHAIYESFAAADADGDGQISRTEFIIFGSMFGETADDASATFTLLDKDGNGHLSFQEWVEGWMSEVNRSAENCPGLHGLKYFTTPSDYGCDVCCGVITAGSRAYGCRRCNHDVCILCHSSAVARPRQHQLR